MRRGTEPAAASGGIRQVKESSEASQATEHCEGSLTKIELAGESQPTPTE